jgi:hypothetical protein
MMRKSYGIYFAPILLFVIACQGAQRNDPQTLAKVEELKKELATTRAEIDSAVAKDNELAGGLVKALVSVRLEILRTNEALIQQRINALESGTPIKIQIVGTTPDPNETLSLEKEIQLKRDELTAQKKDADRYSGGLVLAMKMSTIATTENTLAMLEQRRLAAKYGLSYMVSNKGDVKSPSEKTQAKKQQNLLPSEELIAVKLINKRYNKVEYQEYITFDIEYNPVNISKPTRSIKGILLFCDLFGEVQFRLGVTINEPLIPGEVLTKRGSGFEFNEFKDDEKWVRATDVENMTFRYQVTSILYADGQRVDY